MASLGNVLYEKYDEIKGFYGRDNPIAKFNRNV